VSPFIIPNSLIDINYFFVVLIFYIGCCGGSFSHAYANGIIKSFNVLRRSECDSCKKKLYWFHLFPIFSYLCMKGKCSFCEDKIKIELLFFEVFFGIIFVIYFTSLSHSSAIIFSALSIFAGSIYETDRKLMIIHTPTLFLILIFNFIYLFIQAINYKFMYDFILLFIFGLSIIFIISYLYYFVRGIQGFGSGDKWLLGVIATFFNYSDIVYIFLYACIFGSLVGIINLLIKGKFHNIKLPFGSFLCLVTIIYPILFK